jgi:hypothetical protein
LTHVLGVTAVFDQSLGNQRSLAGFPRNHSALSMMDEGHTAPYRLAEVPLAHKDKDLWLLQGASGLLRIWETAQVYHTGGPSIPGSLLHLTAHWLVTAGLLGVGSCAPERLSCISACPCPSCLLLQTHPKSPSVNSVWGVVLHVILSKSLPPPP